MEWIRSWVMGVTCAALVAAIAQTLMPKGPVKQIGQFTAGLVLLLAVVGPVFTLDASTLSQALAQWRTSDTVSLPASGTVNGAALEGLIAQEASAYIAGKAAELGAECRVEVEVSREQGDYPVPWSVTVTGALTDGQREDLAWQIEADFAIPAERQTYRTGEEGES